MRFSLIKKLPLSQSDTVEVMILSRYRFRASVTDRMHFWVNVTDRHPNLTDRPQNVTKRYIALLCVAICVRFLSESCLSLAM